MRTTAARAALGVSAARLRAQPLRPVLVLVGVALAFAMLVAVVGGSLVSRQQALDRANASVPTGSRGFRVDRFGTPLSDRTYRREDRAVRRVLGTLSGGEARRIVFFRQLRVAGRLVEIAAVDRLSELIRLRSGRLPRTCTPAACEVLQIGGGGRPRFDEGDIRMARVGTADLRDPAFFGYVAAAAEGPTAAPVVLVAPSVEAVQHLASLQPFYRVYSWLSPLRADTLHTWDVGRTLAAESRGQAALYTSDSAFRLSSPDEQLLETMHRGRVASRRLVLVGGETSALLLGFAIIAAIGLRRGLASERRRLLARGARRWQATLALGSEVGAMTLAGALGGIAAGTLVVAAIARAAGQPVGPILSHSLLSTWTLAALAGGVAGTTLVLAAATLTRDDGSDGRGIRLSDVAALGAAVTIVVALSRGALDPDSVGGGNTVLLLLLPALVCFVVAVVLARLLGPAMRTAERLTRRRSLSLRLGVLALARAPSRTVVSCAFITVALGLALFAAGYRATLARGAADQAAFEVPLDYTVAEGSKLVLPLDAAPASAYPGDHAYPVVRVSATTPGSGTEVLSPTVLGVPAAAIRRMHWRSDFSSLPIRTIAAKLSADGEPRLQGANVPTGTRTLATTARLRGVDVLAWLLVADARGRISRVSLGRVGTGTTTLTARLPRSTGPLRVLGIRLALPESEAFMLAHDEAEGAVSLVPSGELSLGPLVAAGGGPARQLTDYTGWKLSAGGDVLPRTGGTTIRFAFPDTGLQPVFRPAQPTDGGTMPVVVSPDIARAAGGVGATTVLDFQDTKIDSRIVGVASRMPSVPADVGPFVLADADWLSTALDSNAPGEGTPGEVWISAAGDGGAVGRALEQPPFSSLVVTSRRATEHRLAGDPLAHATAVALGAAGLVALLLAVLGFWVGVVSELHDEKSDFFDLEAQGLAPEDMRRQLRVRGAILLGLGLAGGLALGLILSRLVVGVLRVSGTTGVPEPPLLLDPDWLVAGLGIAALLLAALLVAEGASLAAFRGERPERASWSLE